MKFKDQVNLNRQVVMRMLISLFLLTFFGLFTAYIAKKRGRDPVAWFMIGMFLGIFAPLLVMILPPINLSKEEALTGTEENEDMRLDSFEFHSFPSFQKEWYYIDQQGNQVGPYSFQHLKAFWEEGALNKRMFVWAEGMEQWQRIAEFSQLEIALDKQEEPLLIEGI